MSVENQEADRAFALGLTHHQAGRLNDAEDLYRKALDLVPTHADALHLYGVLRAQSGDFTLAADLVTGGAVGSKNGFALVDVRFPRLERSGA